MGIHAARYKLAMLALGAALRRPGRRRSRPTTPSWSRPAPTPSPAWSTCWSTRWWAAPGLLRAGGGRHLPHRCCPRCCARSAPRVGLEPGPLRLFVNGAGAAARHPLPARGHLLPARGAAARPAAVRAREAACCLEPRRGVAPDLRRPARRRRRLASTVEAGRGARPHRPERRRQDHAPQPDLRAASRPPPAPSCSTGERIDGLPPPPHRRARGVTRTYQNIRLFPELTAADNVLVGAAPAAPRPALAPHALPPLRRAWRSGPRARPRWRCSSGWACRSGLGERASNLSYGEQRRVEIARALASRAAGACCSTSRPPG